MDTQAADVALQTMAPDRVEKVGWIDRVLGVKLDGTGHEASARREPVGERLTSQGVNVNLAKLKLKWNDARSQARGQLAALQTAMTGEFDDANTAASAADVIAVMDYFGEGLGDTLDGLYTADDDRRKADLCGQASMLIRDYQTYIENNELIEHIQLNPFVPVTMTALLLPPLQEIAAALGQIEHLAQA